MFIRLDASLELLRLAPDWLEAGTNGQNYRTFVALMEEVDTALPVERTIERIGCPTVTDKVLESIMKLIYATDGKWIPPATETMNAIAQVVKQPG